MTYLAKSPAIMIENTQLRIQYLKITWKSNILYSLSYHYYFF